MITEENHKQKKSRPARLFRNAHAPKTQLQHSTPLHVPTSTMHVGNCLDVLRTLPTGSVNCIVTSPPYYGLRDYGHPDQLGAEPTVQEYINNLMMVFNECHRVLAKNGVMFINIADTYAGGGRGGNPPDSKHQKQRTNRGSYGMKDCRVPKQGNIRDGSLFGVPARLEIALVDSGIWVVRSDIQWLKPNPMPESVKTRPSRTTESVFMVTKSRGGYYYKQDFEPTVDGKGTRNHRNIIELSVSSAKTGHIATYPTQLATILIERGCPEGGTVLDPFMGSGSTGVAAVLSGRNCVGIECNSEYAANTRERIAAEIARFVRQTAAKGKH